jgi:hypothetical protein
VVLFSLVYPHVGSCVLVHEQTAQHIMQQYVVVDTTDCVVLSKAEGVVEGYGARNDTTQQSGQTPDKEVEIKNITVYVSGYTEMLSPPTVWRQQSQFVSSRQSGQILDAVRIGSECRCNGQNGCRFKCSHTFLQCMPRQMLVCCVVSVLAPM